MLKLNVYIFQVSVIYDRDVKIFAKQILDYECIYNSERDNFDGGTLARYDDLLSATIIIIAIANAILFYRKAYPNGYGYNSPPFTRRKYTSAFSLSLGLHTERRSKTVVEVSI